MREWIHRLRGSHTDDKRETCYSGEGCCQGDDSWGANAGTSSFLEADDDDRCGHEHISRARLSGLCHTLWHRALRLRIEIKPERTLEEIPLVPISNGTIQFVQATLKVPDGQRATCQARHARKNNHPRMGAVGCVWGEGDTQQATIASGYGWVGGQAKGCHLIWQKQWPKCQAVLTRPFLSLEETREEFLPR